MLDYKTSIAYLDGKFIDFKDANLSIASSPILYGLTIYTVMSANWNKEKKQLYIFRLKDHYQRLVNSAKIMDLHSFAENSSYAQFEELITSLLKRNNVKQDVFVRVSVFVDELIAGTKIHGLKNSLSAFVYPSANLYSASGIHCCISSWQRTPDNSQPSRAKVNGSYVNSSLMKNEALLNGYDEAIALDQHGHVTEGTVANLFLVRDGTLLTPDNSTDILEGITRNSIIQLAKDLNIPVTLRPIDRSELYIADEVFMCGSSARITPVLSIDRRPIGSQKSGVLTQKLSKLYNDLQHSKALDTRSWLLQV